MKLEHVNLTVRDPKATAAMLCELFDWQVRWEGDSIYGGHTVHVGDTESYLALYAPPKDIQNAEESYYRAGGLNHIGIVVTDLDMIEARVKAAGFVPVNHADYEPGKRFYFDGPDDVEYEVISYA
ncbi:MAG: VOC family protein [Shimia sp.]|uniref:VOC family protein n=1 Tax=Shimia sp. TaxID=1954381 RepID=UPI001B2359FF|nr:VOC family protein [Shimia sp.]MBO6896325.1 VOC family protein [Shimia sp.]